MLPLKTAFLTERRFVSKKMELRLFNRCIFRVEKTRKLVGSRVMRKYVLLCA